MSIQHDNSQQPAVDISIGLKPEIADHANAISKDIPIH